MASTRIQSLEKASPAVDAAPFVVSDVTRYPAARALYVGQAGDVNLVTRRGNSVLFRGVLGGSILPVENIGVNDDGTDAGDLVALY
jgi:hypothetical protein